MQILNFGDHTLTNTCAVFLIKAAIGEQSPAKRPNCNQDSSVFLIRPVGTFCSASSFCHQTLWWRQPSKLCPDWLSLSFYAQYQLFWDKNIRREGIRQGASFWICVILIWICEIFYSDLWDWLNCWGGVEVGKEGTKGPPWPGAIQQRWASTKPPFNWEIARIQTFPQH